MTTKNDQENRYWLTDAGYQALDDGPVTPRLVLVPLLDIPMRVDVPRPEATA